MPLARMGSALFVLISETAFGMGHESHQGLEELVLPGLPSFCVSLSQSWMSSPLFRAFPTLARQGSCVVSRLAAVAYAA